MGIIRTSASALRALSHQDKHYGSLGSGRMFAQLSQTMLKVEQSAVPKQSSDAPVVGLLFPATLALLGLSISTFCTHQLMSTSGSSQASTADRASEDASKKQ